MLYPQSNRPLSPELFKNPTSEYRATPFWAWNNKLDPKELIWQIEQLKLLGYGGFHMHVRTGLATEYLSNEFFDAIEASVEKARSENMLAWLYDEDRWPSGAAGGLLTKEPQYRSRHLLLTRTPYQKNAFNIKSNANSSAAAQRAENGLLLACFDIELSPSGDLMSYMIIDESSTAKGFKLYAYEETSTSNPWYNNQTYADTLDPKAIQEFIKLTYEPYSQRFGDDFGGVVPAIFTDEPQFPHKGTLSFAHEDKDVTLPWTTDITETFKLQYNGKNLLFGLPELLWDLPNGEVSTTRYQYHDHVAERFASAFADQCGTWCKEHGLMLTGHMMEEPTLESQTAALGEAMRSYRSFQLPGIDMLCDHREYTTAKQAQSAARQYGCPGVLSELYGVTNWDFDFRGHKLQGDWQAALGVTVRVPHLSWVSMNGEAKRDYPSTFNYQVPWYKEYPYVENHFARVNTAMTRGKAISRVGVIHPVESYWLHWGAKETTQAIREQMDKNFHNLTEWLICGLIDFDFISESLFPDQCALENITTQKLPVGEMNYDVILVPAMETIRLTTLERLEAFEKAGGRLIFLGNAPTLVNAVPSNRPNQLSEKSELIGFERLTILDSLEDSRDIDIRTSAGASTENLIYQLRKDGSYCWLFIAHADKPVNPDIPVGDILRIKIRGEYGVTLCDTISGEILPMDSTLVNGWTTLQQPFYEHDSLLLCLDKTAKPNNKTTNVKLIDSDRNGFTPFKSIVNITLHEPNALLLDIAEYALNDEKYRSIEEVLRLDNILRDELDWPSRNLAVAQPWVEHDETTPHTLRLCYKINSNLELFGTKLALENAEKTKISLNGELVSTISGWYVDKCIQTVSLPPIKKGENILELIIPFGKKTDVEACYLLGDFGVTVTGCNCTLTKPVTQLAFGDIAGQGLPFYGGNITYHMEVETNSGTLEIAVPYYRGHLLKCAVNGEELGVIAYSPYRLTANKLKAGKQKIDITYFGSRVNTFGQLHRNDRHNQWWGPSAWRSNGDSWTYQYRFWEQGILKSPDFFE